MRLIFETKQTKRAREIRQWILKNLGVECTVVVTPSNTDIWIEKDVDASRLVKWLKREMDAKLIKQEGGEKLESDSTLRDGRERLYRDSSSGGNEEEDD